MISINRFFSSLREAAGREPNAGQRKAVVSARQNALLVVAGPSTENAMIRNCVLRGGSKHSALKPGLAARKNHGRP